MAPETATRTIPAAGRWEVDPAHTTAEFVARHILTPVRGRFNEVSGRVEVADDPTQSKIEAAINTASVFTNEPKRDGHLRSPDFFDVENHPTITFRSTSVTDEGEGRYKVFGDLTIRDVTREIALDAEFLGVDTTPFGTEVAAFSASTEVEREDWGLTWNLALESGGWLVSKRVKLEIHAEQVHQQDS
jgi:polyisoprenoid-binding protein YceI